MSNSKSKSAVLLILVLLLASTTGFLGYNLMNKIEESETIESTKAERDNLISELEKMEAEYAGLMLENDSLSSEMAGQQEKIQALKKEIAALKGNAAAAKRRFRNEVRLLKERMEGYIFTIDSLNTINDSLVTQNSNITFQLGSMTNERDQLASDKTELQDIVEKGSLLRLSGLTAKGVRIKNSGKEKVSDKISKIDVIKTCFTVVENKIAKSGNKDIYVRIIDPNAQILPAKTPEMFTFNGSKGICSAKRTLNYRNKEESICIYWDTNPSMTPGLYKVEIYESGILMGETSITLR